MVDSVLCYSFPCKTLNCPAPIMLPIDTFERLFPDRGVPANDDLSVILVCDPCKTAHIYSPDRRSLYHDPKMRQVSWPRSGETKIELWLKCEEGRHEFRVPLVVTWTEGRTVEEKSEIEKLWHGEHLQCAEGHRILWPWKRTEVAHKSPMG